MQSEGFATCVCLPLITKGLVKGVLTTRIFAVVDVYDALTSDRPYRKAWSEEDTLALIKKDSGSHFDPEVVEVFMKVR